MVLATDEDEMVVEGLAIRNAGILALVG